MLSLRCLFDGPLASVCVCAYEYYIGKQYSNVFYCVAVKRCGVSNGSCRCAFWYNGCTTSALFQIPRRQACVALPAWLCGRRVTLPRLTRRQGALRRSPQCLEVWQSAVPLSPLDTCSRVSVRQTRSSSSSPHSFLLSHLSGTIFSISGRYKGRQISASRQPLRVSPRHIPGRSEHHRAAICPHFSSFIEFTNFTTLSQPLSYPAHQRLTKLHIRSFTF